MLAIVLACFGATAQETPPESDTKPEHPMRFELSGLPTPPAFGDDAAVGRLGEDIALLVFGGDQPDSATVYTLAPDSDAWTPAGELSGVSSPAITVSNGSALYVLGEDGDTQAVRATNGTLSTEGMSDLPGAPRAAAMTDGKMLVAVGDALFSHTPLGTETGWEPLGGLPDPTLTHLSMAGSQGRLYLFGRGPDGGLRAWSWTAAGSWFETDHPADAPGSWPDGASIVPVGPTHLFTYTDTGGGRVRVLAYHTITDRWTDAGELGTGITGGVRAVPFDGDAALIGASGAMAASIDPVTPPFIWLDFAVVAVYLLGMVGMGLLFLRRESSSDDFFRGGRKIPWWATGMSMFATGASAISLMSMPAQSYAIDWGYFGLTIFSILALPISLFLVAPIVRRLNIATANEYLEKRFGLTTRMFASVIYILVQVCGRMAPVMLLPALALTAITGIDVWVSIVIMGGITTAYTFVGGLKAVIWTDTVQGVVMCLALASCLVLVMVRLGVGPGEMAAEAAAMRKLNVIDFSPTLFRATAWCFLLQSVVFTFGYIADQNYVQRIQAVPTLRDARRALTTQLAVAMPVNVLVFALGTALWFFYRSRPEDLNPTMETDSIYPFFVAQQLPVGVSGLVVAALLAATMSTVSSSICSVSDLGVNDFYRRFFPGATEERSVIAGRLLTAVVGVTGTLIAYVLSHWSGELIWDRALILTGMITNSVIGIFWLGLFSKRANEVGALAGVVVGIAAVWWCRENTGLSLLIYQAIGASGAIVVGLAVSAVVPVGRRDVTGLTLGTMDLSRADDHDTPPERENKGDDA